MICLITKAT